VQQSWQIASNNLEHRSTFTFLPSTEFRTDFRSRGRRREALIPPLGTQSTREGSRLPIYPLRQRCLRIDSLPVFRQESGINTPPFSFRIRPCTTSLVPGLAFLKSQTTTTEVSEWFVGIQTAQYQRFRSLTRVPKKNDVFPRVHPFVKARNPRNGPWEIPKQIPIFSSGNQMKDCRLSSQLQEQALTAGAHGCFEKERRSSLASRPIITER
jgi:hypothetical protein